METTVVESCGYFAAYAGTLLEGEISLLTAMVAARAGYLDFFVVMAVAFSGAYTRDWITFLVARKKGKKLIENQPGIRSKIEKTSAFFAKYPNLTLSTYRMIFGMSTFVILTAGLGHISFKKFGFHSAVSCLLWAGIYGNISFFCADVMLENLNWARTHVLYLIFGLVFIGALVWFFVKRKQLKIP
ncbi:MAG: DedA family protein [Bacteroidetes bacterium]|nr:MAG: DedA family protein [Bacteroidota bacterium]